MRIVLPLPFSEMEINIRRSRRGRAMFWYVALSMAFHFIFVSLLVALAVHSLLPTLTQKPPQEIVAVSSAIRLEKRARPVPARRPVAQPRTVAVVRQPQRPVPKQTQSDKPVVRKQPVQRRELSKIAKTATIAYAKTPAQAKTPTVNPAQLQAQTQAFQQTIAQAKAANDPVAGAAGNNVTPASNKRYTLNIEGNFGKPQPEGVLYPLKRWTQDGYVYYYVRYLAEYADGATESGIVPWPVRFPENADPFANGRHRMPLPGPMQDYVASSGGSMTPLIKNCYDHRYSYCPIEHE